MPRWRKQLDPDRWTPTDTSVVVGGIETTAHAVYIGKPDGEWGGTQREWIQSLQEWHEWHATAWAVTLKVGEKEHRTTYSMGSAHRKPPRAVDVVESLFMDASGGAEPFEEWASDYGIDPDSRKGYAAWEACRATSLALRELYGRQFHDIAEVIAENGEIPRKEVGA